MRWTVALVAAVLVAAAGCTGDGGEEAPTPPPPDPAPAPEATPGPSPSPTPTPPEPAARAPLTGAGVDDPGLLDRPAVAVRVDDAPGARPQVGLAAADLVVSEPLEGGVRRFLALFHAEEPDEVGPVRSARASDAALASPHAEVLAVSGAAPGVLAGLREAGMTVVEEGLPPAAWRREPERRAPHNLFVDLAEVRAEVGEAAAPERPWPIAERGTAEPEGSAVDALRLPDGTGWHRDGQRWQRGDGDVAHVDAAGQGHQADNVVLVHVDPLEGGGEAVAHDLVGRGAAHVLRQGGHLEATWHRPDSGAPLELEADGRSVELAAGSTWLELVPTDAEVVVEGG